MNTITVYDPPMCCATGVCGADVDQQIVTFAADLDWLKSQGVGVRRINLAQEPQEFVCHTEIKALMDRSGGDALPAILVQGKIVAEARYPSRAELNGFVQSDVAPAPTDRPAREPVPSEGAPRTASGCCGGSSKTGAASDEATTCC